MYLLFFSPHREIVKIVQMSCVLGFGGVRGPKSIVGFCAELQVFYSYFHGSHRQSGAEREKNEETLLRTIE